MTHPNVMRLLGVCFLEGETIPSVVSPLMKTGNAREYFRATPASEIDFGNFVSSSSLGCCLAGLMIIINQVLGIAFGLSYLHEREIVHGDIRGVRSLALNSHTPFDK